LSIVPETQTVSRQILLEISDNQRLLEPPEIDGFDYILHILQDLGFTDSEGKGLSYSEIESYCNLSGEVLSSWETITLKYLSSDFASQLMKKDINEETPYKND